MNLHPPADNEIEISVFGPGLGECILCHMGSGRWLVVDSFIDGNSAQPIALAYLRSLGIDPSAAIKLIVATHWHDDHIRGLADILKAAPEAAFAITSAFAHNDFNVALSPWLANSTIADGKGLTELHRVIQLGRKPALASENKILFERPDAVPCRVVALAPSDAAVISCIGQMQGLPRVQFRTRLPVITDNHASVVLSIEFGERRVLLGGDLQVRMDRKFGWLAVVDSQLQHGRAPHHLYKIPHHGSQNGDHDEIWQHLLVPRPTVVVTPFIKGAQKLPSPEDSDRISRRAGQALLTAPPNLGKFRHPDRTVEKTMREVCKSLGSVSSQIGHVRLRGNPTLPADSWELALAGAAHQL